MRPARLLPSVLLCCVLANRAAAAPFPILAGLSAGLTDLQPTRLGTGPHAGIFGEVAVWDQFSLTGTVQRSFHTASFSQTVQRRSQLDIASLGALYRIDVTRVIPYAGLVGQYRLLRVEGLQSTQDLAGSLALGVVVPLGSRFFAGAEARYGLWSSSPALGWARDYQLRAGVQFGSE